MVIQDSRAAHVSRLYSIWSDPVSVDQVERLRTEATLHEAASQRVIVNAHNNHHQCNYNKVLSPFTKESNFLNFDQIFRKKC